MLILHRRPIFSSAGGIVVTPLTLQSSSTSQATNFNFASVTTPRTGLIYISINCGSGVTGFDSVQIDGVAATQRALSQGSGIACAIYSRVITSTTFAIDVDPNATSAGMIVKPYLIEGATEAPTDTITANATNTGTIDVAAGGLILATLSHWNGAADSQTITGLATEDYDADSGNSTNGAGGHEVFVASDTGKSISFTGGTFDCIAAVALDAS